MRTIVQRHSVTQHPITHSFLFSVMHTTVQRHSVTHNTLSHTSDRSLLILRNAHYCSTIFCHTAPYHTLLGEAFSFPIRTLLFKDILLHYTLSQTSRRSFLFQRNVVYFVTQYHITQFRGGKALFSSIAH